MDYMGTGMDSMGIGMGMGPGMMMGMDPLYLGIMVVTMIVSLLAQFWTKAAFAKYGRMGNTRNLTGAQAAAEMLRDEGVSDVQIKRYDGGMLSDHYDPRTKVVNLSPEVYDNASIAAVGVACHEAGHALQHARGYAPLKLRSLLVGPTTFASKASIPILLVGLALQSLGMAKLGLLLFGVTFLFQVVTLPVEINASMRSKRALVAHGIVAPGAESRGVSAMLTAAACTYIAAAFSTLMYLLYWAYRLGLLDALLGRRRGD